ncbi:hypothetical protein CAL7716_106800 (plasmid) [Calothrix sp. PCC 7716]|nr:hypothetical protein CAL7716_106800 [Calothrix sp. PCC 7716]
MKKFLHKHGTVIALTLAGFFHLVSHLGTQFERYQICFAPSEKAMRGCEKDIDLVVLKQLYDLSLYGEGNGSEFKREWIDIIKKSTVVREIPATNPDIPKYSLAVLGLIIYARYNQGLKASALQNSYSSDLEAFKTQVYENWVHGFNERKVIFKKQEFQAEKEIAEEINKLRGKGELTHLQEVLKRSNTIDEAKFDLALSEIAAKKSEFSKSKAENLRDAAKADKESQKILGMKNNDQEPEGATSTKLELDEQYRWIYQLLKLPFRVLSGEQGSGKSTLERLMIRLLKDDGYHVIIVNPETNPSVWGGVQVLTDAPEINLFFESFPVTIQERKQQAIDMGIDEDDYLDYLKDKSGLEGKVAIFLMESNTYEVHGVDPDHWANFLKQSLTNIRKWGFTVCLTAHSDNQTAVSSKLSGFSKNIDAAPRVECIPATNNDGEAVSSGKAWLKMKGVNDKEPVEVSLYNYPKSKKF